MRKLLSDLLRISTGEHYKVFEGDRVEFTDENGDKHLSCSIWDVEEAQQATHWAATEPTTYKIIPSERSEHAK